jgi:F-type H+-transporting ATPase subunit a
MPLLAADNPLEHVIDKPLYKLGENFWLISDVTVMLVLAGIVVVVTMIAAAKRIRTGNVRTAADYRTEGVWANVVESTCVFLRNDIFKPILREHTDRYTPLLWTFFFFILICNLFGLVPLRDLTWLLRIRDEHGHGIGGTATQSIWVTGALALIAFIYINLSTLVKDPIGYLKHMTAGTPWPIWFIMIPVEFLGILIKPFALCLRLFANMTGGHVVVAVMLMFVKLLIDNVSGAGYALSAMPAIAIVGIYFLEILVALIQAFVFTFLTCLFIAQLVVHEHHDEEHGQEHGHAPRVIPHPEEATTL